MLRIQWESMGFNAFPFHFHLFDGMGLTLEEMSRIKPKDPKAFFLRQAAVNCPLLGY